MTQDHILRAGSLCVWTLSCAIHILDCNDLALPPHEAEEVHDLLLQHLLHCQGLWQHFHALNIKRWKQRPKQHDLEHLAIFTKQTRLNVRCTSCFQDESYLGVLKHVAVKCSSSTVLLRMFQRILLNLSVRWKHNRDQGQSWKKVGAELMATQLAAVQRQRSNINIFWSMFESFICWVFFLTVFYESSIKLVDLWGEGKPTTLTNRPYWFQSLK